MLVDIQPQIINRWSSKETEYVFPFIRPEMTVRRKKAFIKQFSDMDNGFYLPKEPLN
jgi:hypothetical protein